LIEANATEVQSPIAPRATSRFLAELSGALSGIRVDALERAAQVLLHARKAGRRVYVMGNGGSAATATHLVCDLMKGAQVAGLQPLRAFALSDNSSLVTAWANDVAYDQIFAQQLAALLDPADVVVAITASGQSPNVLAGLTAAAEKRARTIGLVGFDGGEASRLVDVLIHVPSSNYGVVEACHLAIGQALVAVMRETLEHEVASLEPLRNHQSYDR
jgi:D-sedoheptulose 7-phosphate isomerase